MKGNVVMQKNTNRKSGFTLVEIMIVVAIIGLLAAIAIPSFLSARNQSRKNACINYLRQIDSAKEQWAMANNKNDGDSVAMDDLLGNGNLSNGYIKQTPQCKAGGTYTIGTIGTNPTCNVSLHTIS